MKPTIIGLISDTHGLLREEAVEALRGSELILHAGDIGKQGILEELQRLAPVLAVVEAGPATVFMLHNLQELNVNPAAVGFHVVVSGHSHQHSQLEKNGVRYINPGSAGPRRFRLPVTVARLDLAHTPWEVHFFELERRGSRGFDKRVRGGVG